MQRIEIRFARPEVDDAGAERQAALQLGAGQVHVTVALDGVEHAAD